MLLFRQGNPISRIASFLQELLQLGGGSLHYGTIGQPYVPLIHMDRVSPMRGIFRPQFEDGMDWGDSVINVAITGKKAPGPYVSGIEANKIAGILVLKIAKTGGNLS